MRNPALSSNPITSTDQAGAMAKAAKSKAEKRHSPESKFTQPLFDKICDRLSNGESLRKICLDDDMPSQTAVFKWLKRDSILVEQYTRARESQADTLFDDCLSIADQYEATEKTDEAGTDHIQRARLRIDTRKWMAGKLRPKKYGDKTIVDLNVSLESMDDAELAAELAGLKAKSD